jgi:hypothetical protein
MKPQSTFMAALRRLRIRRSYNRGNYLKAKALSKIELSSPINQNFASDIILRCLYNRQEWLELISFAQQHPSEHSSKLSSKAEQKLFSEGRGREVKPKTHSNREWNESDPLSNWYQEQNRLWLRYPNGWVFWDMPKGFELSKIHPSLLQLTMNILFQPLGIRYSLKEIGARQHGSHAGLAFSGGVDSTAAAILLPKNTILSYHQRSFPSVLNHGLAERLFEKLENDFDRSILRVSSNHELIRASIGKSIGFSTDFAAGVHLILLSDMLDLGTIAFGTPMDNTWLFKGAKYRDFPNSKYWIRWKKYFTHAGLHLEFPINHISEAGTLKICQKSGFIEYINSCLRGSNGLECGKCWKCFNKNGPLGRKIQFDSKEIQEFIHRVPLKTGVHALWSLQSQNLEHRVSHLHHLLGESFAWWEMYYEPGLKMIGVQLRDVVEKNTKRYLQPMGENIPLERVNLYP